MALSIDAAELSSLFCFLVLALVGLNRHLIFSMHRPIKLVALFIRWYSGITVERALANSASLICSILILNDVGSNEANTPSDIQNSNPMDSNGYIFVLQCKIQVRSERIHRPPQSWPDGTSALGVNLIPPDVSSSKDSAIP